MGVAVTLLFDRIVVGSAEVARGEWRTLPVLPVLVMVGAIVAAAVHMGLLTKVAVRRAHAECAATGPERRGD